jgi:cell shape-determining protein MreC
MTKENNQELIELREKNKELVKENDRLKKLIRSVYNAINDN